MNAVLLANLVMDDLVYKRRDEVLCKLNMEKAYDHINWGFLSYMLDRMDFRVKQCK